MPFKALSREDTQIYWIETAGHKNFSFEDDQLRSVFVNCMDSLIKEFDNMRLLKIKEFWDKADDDLVFSNNLTKQGIWMYWKAMDASFKFNVLKRRDFLIRTNFRQLKTKPQQQHKTAFKNVKNVATMSVRNSLSEGMIHDDANVSNRSPDRGSGSGNQQVSFALTLSEMQAFFRLHQEWKAHQAQQTQRRPLLQFSFTRKC